jgi:cbb3-type cytochrome oxidase maturation protein
VEEKAVNVIPVLLTLALALAGFFTFAFGWMAMNGQFDDLETPAHRMLLDEDGEERQNG